MSWLTRSLAARKEKKARTSARRPPPFRWPVQIAVEQLEERELLNASVANNDAYSVVKNQTLDYPREQVWSPGRVLGDSWAR